MAAKIKQTKTKQEFRHNYDTHAKNCLLHLICIYCVNRL